MITYRNSIGRRFIVRILLFSMVITTLLTGIQLYLDYRNGIRDIENTAQLVERSYREGIVNSLWVIDPESLQIQLDGINKLPDAQYVELRKDGKVLAFSGTPSAGRNITHRWPLSYEYRGRRIDLGELSVQFTLSHLWQRLIEKIAVISVSQAIKTLLVSLFIFYIFYRLVGRHLGRIARYALNLKSHNLGQPLRLDERAPHRGVDEIDELVDALNAMREEFLQYQQQSEQAKQALNLFKLQIDQSRDSLFLIDPVGQRVLEVNQSAVELTGEPRERLVGARARRLLRDIDGMDWVELVRSLDRQDEGLVFEAQVERPSGEGIPVEISAKRVDLGDRRVVVALARDISERRRAQRQLEHQALYDQLTHLPNRALLQLRLKEMMSEADRARGKVALLFIDLDGFKHVNDSYGHSFGDRLLVMVARRLKEAIRQEDLLARLGGDEFVAVVTLNESLHAANRVAMQLIESLAEPFVIDDIELSVQMSIGITLYPDDAEDTESLLRNADSAMYKAKSGGRNQFQFYTPELTRWAERRVQLEQELGKAIENGEFEVHYQPQWDFPGPRLVGAEALVRWRHPERGLVPPGEFIPVAEDTGQISRIDHWVLKRVLEDIRDCETRGMSLPRISVNLSNRSYREQGLVEPIGFLLKRYDCAGDRIEVEITESLLMDDPQARVEEFRRLREMGVSIAIDDFGTGYSSLAYLKLLPLSRLKIDQSFVRDIPGDANDQAIIRAIIALGRSLDLELVAEGVETGDQHDFLLEAGCHIEQGYLYSKPLPLEDFLSRFREQLTRCG